jgi:hypothetical protein
VIRETTIQAVYMRIYDDEQRSPTDSPSSPDSIILNGRTAQKRTTTPLVRGAVASIDANGDRAGGRTLEIPIGDSIPAVEQKLDVHR